MKNTDLKVTNLPDTASAEVTVSEYHGALLFNIRIRPKEGKLELKGLKLRFSLDTDGVIGRWYPRARDRGYHATWMGGYASAYSYGAPVMSFYAADGSNRLTAALSDCFNRWVFNSGANENSGGLDFIATLDGFSGEEYSVGLLADTSGRPYYDSVRMVADWWRETLGSSRVPEYAFDPVFSTWYVYHHDVNEELLIRCCEKAKESGFKTLFIDAGWCVPDDSPGAMHAGDWKPYPGKFPDMKRFVDHIHSLGMKVVLWAAPCVAGYKSRAAKLYEGKFLSDLKVINCHILDPRYPEIRANVCRDFCDLVKSTGIDGLKLDFIDSVSGADCQPDEGRDYSSVMDALRDMLENIHRRLTGINPEFLIEFRQSYTGAEITKNCNILRSGDCPQDSLTNRISTIDLRMHTYSAVHADMVQFMPGETAEVSALQIVNILFSTPQISVDLEKLDERQSAMLRFWVRFMSEKRGLLQHGHLSAHRCDANFTVVEAENDDEKLAALYSERLYRLCGKTQYIVNAFSKEPVVVSSDARRFRVKVLDCAGMVVSEDERLIDGYYEIAIPLCGMAVVAPLD